MTADTLFMGDYCGSKACDGQHVPLALVAGYEASLPEQPGDDEMDAANDDAEIRRALTTAEAARLLAEMTRMRLVVLAGQADGGGF